VALVLPRAVSDHQSVQRRLTLATLSLIRREWSTMGEDLDTSWARIAARLALVTASAQVGAATNGAAYVADALEAQGVSVTAEAEVRPRGLAGVASDGRPLESLLYSAVITVRTAKADALPERLRVGGLWLDRIVQTQVADAARDGAKVAMTARPGVRWVRVVNPPCCQRCAVLTGDARTYSHEFRRHPGCDCTMLPTTVARPHLAGQKLGAGDVTDLTLQQRAALDDGANLHSTINDYQRKRGAFSGYLPPTRIDRVIARAGQREKAMEALRTIGAVA
jgi:hypothetical protein